MLEQRAEYVEKMSRDAEFGYGCTLNSISNEYKVIIWVYQSSGVFKIEPRDIDTQRQYRVLKLSLYDQSQHYNAVE